MANNRGLGELNELARTGAVKAADIRMVQESEDALHDVLGFSHAGAKSIAQRGFKVAGEQPSRLTRQVGVCVVDMRDPSAPPPLTPPRTGSMLSSARSAFEIVSATNLRQINDRAEPSASA